MLKRLILFLILSSIAVACSTLEQSARSARQAVTSQARHAQRTATQRYWIAQGVTPTLDAFAVRATQLVIDTTGTAIARAEDAEQATDTSDDFAQTATILIANATGTRESFNDSRLTATALERNGISSNTRCL